MAAAPLTSTYAYISSGARTGIVSESKCQTALCHRKFCALLYKFNRTVCNVLETDLPNVGLSAHKMGPEILEGCKQFVTFVRSCCCPGQSLFIKDVVKISTVLSVFRRAVPTSYFKNTHLVNGQLEIERTKLSPTPEMIKLISKTHWNGSTVMLRSVLHCWVALDIVFSIDLTAPDDQEALIDIQEKVQIPTVSYRFHWIVIFGLTFQSAPQLLRLVHLSKPFWNPAWR